MPPTNRSHVFLFQSTPPCGGDREDHPENVNGGDFNPRPHAGATKSGRLKVFRIGKFQSTPPCGGDTTSCPGPTKKSLFQSTPPCGGDADHSRTRDRGVISIHAPMRGRRSRWQVNLTLANFNPRPHAGATTGVDLLLCPRPFQSTPPCGGDLVKCPVVGGLENFNPRPHAGATPLLSSVAV